MLDLANDIGMESHSEVSVNLNVIRQWCSCKWRYARYCDEDVRSTLTQSHVLILCCTKQVKEQEVKTPQDIMHGPCFVTHDPQEPSSSFAPEEK